MTEDEAKQKWCPMVRALFVVGQHGVACNVFQKDGEDFKAACIGSDCMMWRKVALTESLTDLYKEGAESTGYCGLAGKL